jgi:CMP-N-acetylneuraminic acid synthetase
VIGKMGRRIGDKPYIVEVNEIESIDIDEQIDFEIADAIFNYFFVGKRC